MCSATIEAKYKQYKWAKTPKARGERDWLNNLHMCYAVSETRCTHCD